jgi:hypothetical protein
LPADSMTIARSPGVHHVDIFEYVDTLSTPELVRVSDMNTSPREIRIPTQ